MKIPTEIIKRQYELTYLLSATLSAKELEEARSEIDSLIKKYKGQVVSTDEWGKKPLAYKIKAGKSLHTQAVYVHQVVEFPTTQAPLFAKQLNLQPQIMRYLLVLATD